MQIMKICDYCSGNHDKISFYILYNLCIHMPGVYATYVTISDNINI